MTWSCPVIAHSRGRGVLAARPLRVDGLGPDRAYITGRQLSDAEPKSHPIKVPIPVR